MSDIFQQDDETSIAASSSSNSPPKERVKVGTKSKGRGRVVSGVKSGRGGATACGRGARGWGRGRGRRSTPATVGLVATNRNRVQSLQNARRERLTV